jgi:hypothetical protein
MNMNDALPQLLKLVPTSALIAFVLLWLLVKALPDSAQFFGDLLPHRRKLSRTLATVEAIKAKVEIFEIVQKHDIQSSINIGDAIRNDIDALLGEQKNKIFINKSDNRKINLAEIIYIVIISFASNIAVMGILSQSNTFVLDRATIFPFSFSFTVSIFFCYAARAFLISLDATKRFSIVYVCCSLWLSFMGGLVGVLIGANLQDGAVILYKLL